MTQISGLIVLSSCGIQHSPEMDHYLQAFFKAVPFVLGAIVLFLIIFGVYVQSVPPKAAAVLKTAADEAFKLGPDGLPKFMASEPMDKDPKIVESDVEGSVSSLHDKSPHIEETLEL